MKNCEHCGSFNLTRDEVDIGVGIQYGPWICQDCGWSEDSGLDIRSFDQGDGDDAPLFAEDPAEAEKRVNAMLEDGDTPSLNRFGGG